MTSDHDPHAVEIVCELAYGGIQPSQFTRPVPVYLSGFSNVPENEIVGEAVGVYESGRMYARVKFERRTGITAPDQVRCVAFAVSAGFVGTGHPMPPFEVQSVTLQNKATTSSEDSH